MSSCEKRQLYGHSCDWTTVLEQHKLISWRGSMKQLLLGLLLWSSWSCSVLMNQLWCAAVMKQLLFVNTYGEKKKQLLWACWVVAAVVKLLFDGGSCIKNVSSDKNPRASYFSLHESCSCVAILKKKFAMCEQHFCNVTISPSLNYIFLSNLARNKQMENNKIPLHRLHLSFLS